MKLNMNYKELVERKNELVALISRLFQIESDREVINSNLLELADIEESLYMLEMILDPNGPSLDLLSMSRARCLELAGQTEDAIQEMVKLIATTKKSDVKKFAEQEKERFEEKLKDEEEKLGKSILQ